jgi:hypothetical protein
MLTDDIMARLAYASAHFLLAVVAISISISLFFQALRDLGLRSFLQQQWIRQWLKTRSLEYVRCGGQSDKLQQPLDNSKQPGLYEKAADFFSSVFNEISGIVKRAGVFALSHSQLCGQISTRAQSLLNDGQSTDLIRLLDFDPAPNKEQGRVDRIEHSIDDLQLFFEQRWRQFDYAAGFGLALCFIALILTWSQRTGATSGEVPLMLYIVVSIAAALLVPQVRPVIERLIRAR